MSYQEKLLLLLDKYVSESRDRRKRHDLLLVQKSLYEDLLDKLKKDNITVSESKLDISLLITSIYTDDIYLDEFYGAVHGLGIDDEHNKKYTRLIAMITRDYQDLLKELDTLNLQIYNCRYLVESANTARTCIRCGASINENKYDIDNVKKILSYYELSGVITSKEEILLINEIETYNRRVGFREGNPREQEYATRLYTDLQYILNAGFQPEDEVEVHENRKNTLDKFVKDILGVIGYLDKDEIVDYIRGYQKYNLQDNEYNYIIVRLLESYNDELVTFYKLLTDKDVYSRRKDRMSIIEGYYKALNVYLIIKKHYDEINTFDEVDTTDELDFALDEVEEEKILIYSHTDTNHSKVRIISDIKDIPYEYYDAILNLIMNFKNGTIGTKKLKKLKTNGEYHQNKPCELKDDQIRIVLKHVRDNIYSVMGVFVKKDDNDRAMYKYMMNRLVPSISTQERLAKELEISSVTEDELTSLIGAKARKGNR